MKQVDARGYSCPTPVLMVQKAVQAEAPSELQALVDDRCAVENITRFGRSQGYQVAVAEDGDDFLLTLTR
ncbi:MAG: sulfurtransferase TusA family protein [Firmicutes bacterium]|nr:sulfurtransferase TusA family protein [Bacillota bacterium]